MSGDLPLISLDRLPEAPPSRRGLPRRLPAVSRLLDWGVGVALAGTVLIAADITTAPTPPQPADPSLVTIDPTGPPRKALSPPTVVTQRLATAGEQITVLVVGAALGASRDGMCGHVELRFDGSPVHHVVRQVRYDHVEPYVTSTAVVTVPPDAAAGDHEIGFYGPFAGVLAGPMCPEAPKHQASVAATLLLVVTAGDESAQPAG